MSRLFVLLFGFVISLSSLLFAGCETVPYNYERFRAEKPRSILVLPPTNLSTDLLGTYGFLSTITRPVAEMGYYIFPVAVIDQMMKENGLPTANEMHQTSLKKIREIINPDAVLYLQLERYGTKFVLVDSQTTVTVSGRLISASSGELLWEGRASATESSSSGDGSLLGLVVNAVVDQAVNSSTDHSRILSAKVSNQLIYTPGRGLLNGPYNVRPNQ